MVTSDANGDYPTVNKFNPIQTAYIDSLRYYSLNSTGEGWPRLLLSFLSFKQNRDEQRSLDVTIFFLSSVV